MAKIKENKVASIDKDVATHTFFDKDFDIQTIKLLPGEYYVTDTNILLVTTLGSCIAACIRDKHTGIGGMNHFMLPNSNTSDADPQLNASARYGTFAMEILINQLLKLGARRSNLEAKVFGGGNVMKELTQSDIGQRNADFVLNYLAIENINVVAQDLVDIFPRKVHFFPKTGKVLVRKLKDDRSNNISENEKSYFNQVNQFNKSTNSIGTVELFS